MKHSLLQWHANGVAPTVLFLGRLFFPPLSILAGQKLNFLVVGGSLLFESFYAF
jgi:hypothetical protein